MSVIYIIASVLYILTCLFLITVIMLQKKRTPGSSASTPIGTNANSYWGKNKSSSTEGALERYTKIGGVLFFVFTVAISLL